MSDKERGYNLTDAIGDTICAFDWISPVLQWIGDLGGMVTVEGTQGEMRALQKHGIKCYNQFAIIGTVGGYVWQIRRQDVKRAQKVLGQ
jgi:hypothetical protein